MFIFAKYLLHQTFFKKYINLTSDFQIKLDGFNISQYFLFHLILYLHFFSNYIFALSIKEFGQFMHFIYVKFMTSNQIFHGLRKPLVSDSIVY